MAQSKVLIVEDDEGLREALIDTLALAGYEWLEADCAEDACSNSNHTVSILWCLMCKWQAWGTRSAAQYQTALAEFTRTADDRLRQYSRCRICHERWRD